MDGPKFIQDLVSTSIHFFQEFVNLEYELQNEFNKCYEKRTKLHMPNGKPNSATLGNLAQCPANAYMKVV